MNRFASLRLKEKNLRSGLVILLAMLIVLEICSVSVLFSQLTRYSRRDQIQVIDLTEGGGDTTVTVREKSSGPKELSARIMAEPVMLSGGNNRDKTHFSVTDNQKVWDTTTEVEIFHLNYRNGEGQITVRSSDKSKVFAPGVGDSYLFTLHNSGDKTLDYSLSVEAWYTYTDKNGNEVDAQWIPIEVRLHDSSPNPWLVGTETFWPDVKALIKSEGGGYSREGRLAAHSDWSYTLDWRWPFERTDGDGLEANDAYDTMLGNLAAEGQDLRLHILIKTQASVDEEPCSGYCGKNPKTGDMANPYLWSAVSMVSLCVILLVAYAMRKDNKDKNNGKAK